MKEQENKENKSSNVCDLGITIINGIFNLLKIEKVACLVVLYLLCRDWRMVGMLNENTDVTSLMIDAKIIEYIISNENTLIVVMGAIIAVLLFCLLFFILYVRPIYVKEIERLSDVRSELMHGKEDGTMNDIKHHRSSKRK